MEMISLLGSAGGLPQDDPGAEHCTKDKIARNDAPSGPALGAGTLASVCGLVQACDRVESKLRQRTGVQAQLSGAASCTGARQEG